MTNPRLEPQLDLDAEVTLAAERVTLEAFLDLYRDTIRRKVAGLTGEQASRRLVGSPTTLAGIVKHLVWVEVGWFCDRWTDLGDMTVPKEPSTPADPDADWRMEPGETLAGLLEQYDWACALSRSVSASRSLEDTVGHPDLGPVSLRWIYVYMIEETARHAGQADILRELLDGAVGF